MSPSRKVPRIVLASDHGGVGMKADLLRFLSGKGFTLTDLGTDSTAPVDYPDYGFAAAAAVRRGEADRAILICKSGTGMAICANKSRGVRAAVVSTIADAELSRRHNDANVLVLGSNDLTPRLVRRITATWLSTPFDGSRHRRRVEKIKRFERAHWKE
ncbi:MAG TPA: RpiB/LacA/LacB family sugar-phosphate isomerase [Candidatus Limnocylindrales bacterium]|nr:RpiB/LacA/LacB family sugar-phosphate isomerase [Candidatus Limnocylindrales bacterium]